MLNFAYSPIYLEMTALYSESGRIEQRIKDRRTLSFASLLLRSSLSVHLVKRIRGFAYIPTLIHHYLDQKRYNEL